MYLIENVLLALAGLKANKMRALLTMLGIIIGIGSVIAIVTVGNSLTASITTSMQGLGTTNIIVVLQEKDSQTNFGPRTTSSGTPVTESDLFTEDMIESLQSRYSKDIQTVSYSNPLGSGKAKDGRLYANVSISGTNEGYAEANNVKIIEGRYLRAGDIKSNRNVAVVSSNLVEKMFKKTESPLGKELKVDTNSQIQTFIIVGVYEYVPSAFGFSRTPEKDRSTEMYIPISTSQILGSSDKGYQNFTVMGKPDTDSPKFAKQVKTYLNKFYENNARFEATTISMESAMSTMTNMLGTLSIAISVIAGISLLVGGIGVMNIMLVSVTERTREIGTRKALGARSSFILTQFIVEAVIICIIGGIIGIVVGMGLGFLGSILLGFPASPSVSIIIIAVLFSMIIGIFFGYYPAQKAAKLDPIEALRYE
jgi:putative ABC transport system permease protein